MRTILVAVITFVAVFWFAASLGLALTLQTSQTSTAGVLGMGVNVKWTDFAYVQYVTNENYLCNSLMILEALHRYGAKADRIMMYPEEWDMSVNDSSYMVHKIESRLLEKARDSYGAKLVPIKIRSVLKGDPTWKDSYTKLLMFNQTQYKRVLSLDSDATVRDVSDYSHLNISSLFLP
jgi:alpha-N-acetylglucosamine transferase